MMNSSTVSAELSLRLVIPQEGIVALVASLYYAEEDPYAIRISFHVGLDEPVEWIFARELLATGVQAETGVGDVKVWPSDSSQGGLPGGVLNIELCSPFGQARFEAPVAQISHFLRRTYQVVPIGQESAHLDVEAELYDLLRQAS